MDGHCLSDGTLIVVKHIYQSPAEIEILSYLASEGFNDPRNHCVPILKIIPVPDKPGDALVVMPLLQVHYMPPFEILDDFLDFERQVLEVRSSGM
jgi:hypothetical protein